MDLFAGLSLAPRDPILGLNEAFLNDNRNNKVNLGIGVYCDESGKLPLLQAVKQAEIERVSNSSPGGYLPIEGLGKYNGAVQKLLFGNDEELIGRSTTIQTLGGSGALRVGADFLNKCCGKNKVAISNPSWENHKAIFTMAGFEVTSYDYYDESTKLVNIEKILLSLQNLETNTVVILHACCHNPTGADLSYEDWQKVITVCQQKHLIPFIDMAYQGFSRSIKEDAQAIELFSKSGLPVLISSSFSKSFSLYGERVGSLTIITDNDNEKTRVLSQVKKIIRTLYSNPPTHGVSIVAEILTNQNLYVMWENELNNMRQRIKNMRTLFVEKLSLYADFNFINAQQGMFSYSGLSAAQVTRLQEEFAIYAVQSGRICVAGLNLNNIDYVTSSIAKVL